MKINITYKSMSYPSLEAVIEGFCDNNTVLIANESLRSVLFDESDMAVDEDADRLDGEIFFYVPNDVMDRDEAEIVKYVRENVF